MDIQYIGHHAPRYMVASIGMVLLSSGLGSRPQSQPVMVTSVTAARQLCILLAMPSSHGPVATRLLQPWAYKCGGVPFNTALVFRRVKLIGTHLGVGSLLARATTTSSSNTTVVTDYYILHKSVGNHHTLGLWQVLGLLQTVAD